MPEIAKGAESEIEPKAAKEAAEKSYTMAERERHWRPINEAVSPPEAAQFVWTHETGSIQSYQHVETARSIHIDGSDAQFYNPSREPITAKEGLDYAMPQGIGHSHSLDTEIPIQHGIGMSR